MKNIVILSIIFLSCKNKAFNTQELTQCGSVKKEFVYDIEKSLKNKIIGDSAHLYLEYLNSLKLPDLRKGYAGLIFRLRYSQFESNKSSFFEFNYNEKSKTYLAKYFFYNVYSKDSVKIIHIDSNLKPKSGWNTFAKKFSETKVLNLKSSDSLSDYTVYTDASGVGIDYVNCSKFFFHSYGFIWGNSDKEEAKRILKLLDLIKEEFKTDLIEKTKKMKAF